MFAFADRVSEFYAACSPKQPTGDDAAGFKKFQLEWERRRGELSVEPTAEADRGRHPGFSSFNVFASGPGSLALAFFFDRGCYHVVRRLDAAAYVRLLERITTPAAVGLVLTGNAKEPHDPGPPVVSEEEIRRELGERFEVQRLREFRFDVTQGVDEAFLGWSCWLPSDQDRMEPDTRGEVLACQLHPSEKAVTLFLVETA